MGWGLRAEPRSGVSPTNFPLLMTPLCCLGRMKRLLTASPNDNFFQDKGVWGGGGRVNHEHSSERTYTSLRAYISPIGPWEETKNTATRLKSIHPASLPLHKLHLIFSFWKINTPCVGSRGWYQQGTHQMTEVHWGVWSVLWEGVGM